MDVEPFKLTPVQFILSLSQVTLHLHPLNH